MDFKALVHLAGELRRLAPDRMFRLLSVLLAHRYIDSTIVEQRLWKMDMDDKLRVRTDVTLKLIIQQASELAS